MQWLCDFYSDRKAPPSPGRSGVASPGACGILPRQVGRPNSGTKRSIPGLLVCVARSGRHWPISVQTWLASAHFGRPELADIGPSLGDSGHLWSNLLEVGPNFVELGPTLPRFRAKFRPNSADSGQFWSMPATSTDFGRNLADSDQPLPIDNIAAASRVACAFASAATLGSVREPRVVHGMATVAISGLGQPKRCAPSLRQETSNSHGGNRWRSTRRTESRQNRGHDLPCPAKTSDDPRSRCRVGRSRATLGLKERLEQTTTCSQPTGAGGAARTRARGCGPPPPKTRGSGKARGPPTLPATADRYSASRACQWREMRGAHSVRQAAAHSSPAVLREDELVWAPRSG